MNTVRKIKLTILGDTETRNKQYKWIRDEQYNQYRALNLSMTYMVTNLMLKNNESGLENRKEKDILKIENKIKKDELLKVLSNKDNNELYKEYLTEIDKIMPKSMQETCFYIKVEDINEPNLKEIASTLFSVSNVTSNELSYVKELFNDVTNAFNYLRSKMFLVPLEWWDL
ncbi:hypothetical protein [Clostridium sporogenes]|uniref:hypothetical protein n=1 Tax=Clostridium sporogenes TaxID=1509 RepID=UPI0006B2A5EF|nr:hypothetical protein [Clostridium sporogenes]KOY66143.1 hypothetical protein AN649_10045 [Clostridium sporogenes]MDS1006423.1 hypothetical protein [Clostridium sporogenes]